MPEVNRQGLDQVYSGESSGKGCGAIANIVFVHGLRGHPRRTWEYTDSTGPSKTQASTNDESTVPEKRSWLHRLKHSSRSKQPSDNSNYGHTTATSPEKDGPGTSFWPANELPKVVPQANIYTYGYNADVIEGIFQENNKNSIIQHGNDLMVRLERSIENDLPIIFVAHSLGGIVVKTAIQRCNSNLQPRYKDLLSRVHAVVFCGTPHRGADAAAWGRLAANIVTMALQSSNNRFLSELQTDSQILDLIQEDFLRILHGGGIQVHSFQESRGLSGIKGFDGKVVDDFSSKLGYSLETTETIDANHMDMVRRPGARDISAVIKDYITSYEKGIEQAKTSEPYVHLDRFHLLDYHDFYFHVSKKHPGTCSWLTDNPAFIRWRDGIGCNYFWLHGYPGVGKSVLARHICENLKGSDAEDAVPSSNERLGKPLVCYFFCSDNDERATSPRHLLASIIHQLLFEDPSLAKRVKTKFDKITDSILESIWDLWKILSLVLEEIKSRRLYIVVDGLDELDRSTWRPFLETLRDTIKPSMSAIRVLLTGRAEPLLESILSSWSITQVAVDGSSGNEDDLTLYVRSTINEYGMENSFDEEITQKICTEMLQRADGMFLWVNLAWGHFKDGVGNWTQEILRQKLKELQMLPPGLENLYHRLLSFIDKRIQPELLYLLQWVVAARRPLNLEEMSIALTLIEKPSNLKEMSRGLSLRGFIRRTCPYLIRIDGKDCLTVAHQSFKDFLLRVEQVQMHNQDEVNPFYLDSQKASLQSARDCMVYLGFDDLAQEKEDPWQDSFSHETLRRLGPKHPIRLFVYPRSETFMAKYPFIDYASQFWASHLSGQDKDPQFFRLFKKVLSKKRNYQIMCYLWENEKRPVPYTPIYTALHHGLFGLLESLVKDGYDINVPIDDCHIIHMVENEEDMQTLIRLGANINGQDEMGQTMLLRLIRELKPSPTLSVATEQFQQADDFAPNNTNDFEGVKGIKLWLDRENIDASITDNWGQTALHAAAIIDTQTALTLLKMLLAHSTVDLNREDELGRTPITWAMHYGKEVTVNFLLNIPGIDISKARMQGESALINAAHQGWTDIVMSLLARLNSLSEFVDIHGQNILHWTIYMGMTDAFELALSKDTTIMNGRDNRGMTPLHLAALEGQYHAAKLLLSRGASVVDKTNFGETPLHLAAAGGHLRILKALICELPSPSILNQKDTMGWTMAHHAVVSGSDEIVRYVISLESIDLTRVDRHGRTPFAFAAWLASSDILNMFFANDKSAANMEFKDALGNTLVHLAARGENESTIPFFLARIAEKGNQLNRWEKTALDYVSPKSPLKKSLISSDLNHSQKFLTEVKTSMLDVAREEEPPVHLEWVVAVLGSPDPIDSYKPDFLENNFDFGDLGDNQGSFMPYEGA